MYICVCLYVYIYIIYYGLLLVYCIFIIGISLTVYEPCTSSQRCQNGGTCDNLSGDYICWCNDDYKGTRCESMSQMQLHTYTKHTHARARTRSRTHTLAHTHTRTRTQARTRKRAGGRADGRAGS